VINTKPKSPPRSMTIEQVHDLRAALTYDDLAIRRDIPDFVAFMLRQGSVSPKPPRWCGAMST